MSTPGNAQSAVEALLARVREAPYAQDFYGLLRALENAARDKPRLGLAVRPADEPVRFGQDVELTFAPAAVSSCGPTRRSAPARVGVRFFGLFGPNGPLPLHLTEYVHARLHHHEDPTWQAFADIFHHRMILLLYRAWAQARPALWLDRDDDARFDMYVGSLFGVPGRAFWNRDAVDDAAKRRHAGLLGRGVKNAEGLCDILSEYFGIPVRMETNVGHWMELQAVDRTRLGIADGGCVVGGGAVVGSAVWDRQYKFRIHLGPLSWSDYQRFLPGADGSIAVRDWVRQYVGNEFAWDIAVGLRGTEVPRAALDGTSRIGLSAWLGGARGAQTHGDMVFAPEYQDARMH